MRDYRILVCGGRKYAHRRNVWASLGGLVPSPTLIIQGGATGADALARSWAIENSIPYIEYAVNNLIDGSWPGAGPRRNERMLHASKPHLVVAFPGGKGTADMVRRAKKAGVRTIEVAK